MKKVAYCTLVFILIFTMYSCATNNEEKPNTFNSQENMYKSINEEKVTQTIKDYFSFLKLHDLDKADLIVSEG